MELPVSWGNAAASKRISPSGMLEQMANRNLCRAGMALLALCAALPVLADTQFRIRQMNRNDVPLGKGQCDIRLQVDNEAEVSLRRDTLYIRTVSGRDPRDDGSECNAPLPERGVVGFSFEVRESRGDIVLLSEPTPRTNFAAVVRIRDSKGGEGRYHFRISWQMTGADDRRPGLGDDRRAPAPPDDRRTPPGFGDDRRGGPGFAWNNVIHFNGVGNGESTHSAYGTQRLRDVNVDIDRGGRVLIVFRTNETRRPLEFTGQVIGREGDQYRADVTTDNRRVRGTMYFVIGQRGEVNGITFEGVDGRERLRLRWDRR
jgi:hypothetical protein